MHPQRLLAESSQIGGCRLSLFLGPGEYSDCPTEAGGGSKGRTLRDAPMSGLVVDHHGSSRAKNREWPTRTEEAEDLALELGAERLGQLVGGRGLFGHAPNISWIPPRGEMPFWEPSKISCAPPVGPSRSGYRGEAANGRFHLRSRRLPDAGPSCS